MKIRWMLFIMGLLMVLPLQARVSAQVPMTLQVSPSGTAALGDACPAGRNSVVYRHIQAAVNCAFPGDIITIDTGTYAENLSLSINLTLTGSGDTVIDGNAAGRTITVDDNITVTLENLAVVNGSADLGGGIYSYAGNLVLHSVRLSGNRANLAGGGLYVYAGQAVVENSDVSGNTAPDGAGLYTNSGRIIVRGGAVIDAATSATANAVVIEPLPAESAPIIAVPPQIPPQTASAIANVGAMDASMAAQWIEVFIRAVEAERLSPPIASRIYAYAAITLHEVVAPFTPDMVPLAGRLSLPILPAPDPALTYDPAIAACAALEAVADALFANAAPTTLDLFTALRDQIEIARGEVITVNVYQRSLEYGSAVSAAVIEWMNADNYATTRGLSLYRPMTEPEYWTPLEGQQPLESAWGLMRPFVMPMANSCDVAPDVRFDTAPGSAFYFQAEEVYRSVQRRTPEQEATARYWADGPGTMTPPGHWVAIQNSLVEALDLDLAQAAQMYALTNMAMADGFISTWDSKYRYALLRPINYIHSYIDPAWETIIPTPPFPEYPSGHSVGSGAAAAVLTDLFGAVAFTDPVGAQRGGESRTFATFDEAAYQAAMSRLYGGIHYRDAIENGLEQGRCAARYVLFRLGR